MKFFQNIFTKNVLFAVHNFEKILLNIFSKIYWYFKLQMLVQIAQFITKLLFISKNDFIGPSPALYNFVNIKFYEF